MKKFYIAKGNFSNVYDLCYAETAEDAAQLEKAGWERISRKEAIAKCVEENNRRKYEKERSGYADNLILPFGYEAYDAGNEKLIVSTYGYDSHNEVRAHRDGYMVVRG